MCDYLAVEAEELEKRSGIPVLLVDTAEDLYHHFAWTMFKWLRRCEAEGRPCVFIVPVGPVGQYRRFARLCNEEGQSCRHLVLLGMDEYLDEGGRLLPVDHPLSFRGFVQRELVEMLEPRLRPPEDQVVFPDPEDLDRTDRAIERFGGVDVAFAGVGINGHLAFNEPQPELDVERFAALGSRVVSLRAETRVVNSITASGGSIESIPERAVTVGMRQILGARRLRIYLNREWQPAVIRKLLFGPITSAFPASLARRHPDVALIATAIAARSVKPALR